MADVVRFEGHDGDFMLVEVTSRSARDASDVEPVAAERGITAAVTRLEDSLASVRGAALALLDTVAAVDERAGRVKLDEVTLELGLSFAVEGGVIVAKGSSQAQATVTLSWRAART